MFRDPESQLPRRLLCNPHLPGANRGSSTRFATNKPRREKARGGELKDRELNESGRTKKKKRHCESGKTFAPSPTIVNGTGNVRRGDTQQPLAATNAKRFCGLGMIRGITDDPAVPRRVNSEEKKTVYKPMCGGDALVVIAVNGLEGQTKEWLCVTHGTTLCGVLSRHVWYTPFFSSPRSPCTRALQPKQSRPQKPPAAVATLTSKSLGRHKTTHTAKAGKWEQKYGARSPRAKQSKPHRERYGGNRPLDMTKVSDGR